MLVKLQYTNEVQRRQNRRQFALNEIEKLKSDKTTKIYGNNIYQILDNGGKRKLHQCEKHIETDENVPKVYRRKRRQRIDEECRNLLKEKSELWLKQLQSDTDADKQEYIEQKRQLERMFREKKKSYRGENT
ncbi:hypothetical protein HHI36_019942 [Cryptolaemus montrouzieri]|uniref:Uncharacterized protein n=1 Tax=Cryptolaemus montrouzieri TaxID=559131 RepID=A0ABD2N9I8_9CUCU